MQLVDSSAFSAGFIHRKTYCQGNSVQLGGQSRNTAAQELSDRFILEPERGMASSSMR